MEETENDVKKIWKED